MKIPLSWLKDYVDIDLPTIELARLLTMAGLEVDAIQIVGMPMPEGEKQEFKIGGLAWPEDKFVVARIDEVKPHPNADRLVLCQMDDGERMHTILTGAPSLLEYRDKGPLPVPFKVAYAREGATLYDGHAAGMQLTTLKRTKIRGVESYSMVCSEKELGISELHGDIIYLPEDAPTGMPLAQYMGDVVYDISILPNMIRNACVYGVAREVAAASGKPLRAPQLKAPANGPAMAGQVHLQIDNPEMNPRFVFGLIRDVKIGPSPYEIQRRLLLAGMRPINNIVDATNYAMLDQGQPLHAFDYDILAQRAGGKAPTIITRLAKAGEKIKTLDGVEHTMDDFSILVTDTAGPLAIAGVMGGAESEVNEHTRNVLLEGANWNFISVRKTSAAQRLNTEASYRLSRNLHPELCPVGVSACLDAMARWSGGQIAAGLVDAYPLRYEDPIVQITPAAVRRKLGIDLDPQQIASILTRLEFDCRIEGETVHAKAPQHRTDIGTGVVGEADVLEEVARIYGYDNIPSTRMADELPRQLNRPLLEGIEWLRDILVSLGLQEVVSYRLTSPEREARLLPPEMAVSVRQQAYVRLQNPIAPDRAFMRRSLLASVMEALERNARLSERLAFFEIGPVFWPEPDQMLPAEIQHLAVALWGRHEIPGWQKNDESKLDFFDLKGILELACERLGIEASFEVEAQNPTFHPGKCARLLSNGRCLGVFGELHPLVKAQYDLDSAPILAADIDLQGLLAESARYRTVQSVPVFPPMLEDIAVIVDENLPAAQVADSIRQTGGALLAGVRLFDIFRGAQIGEGKKSLAYSLTYQAPDRTLTEHEATKLRQRIIRRLEQELGAKLRG